MLETLFQFILLFSNANSSAWGRRTQQPSAVGLAMANLGGDWKVGHLVTAIAGDDAAWVALSLGHLLADQRYHPLSSIL